MHGPAAGDGSDLPRGRPGSPLLAWYTPEIVRAAAGSISIPISRPTQQDAIAQLTKKLSQFGAIAAILLAMGSVAGEKQSATAAFVLTKPDTRLALLAAKFAGMAITLAAAVVASGAGAYLYTSILFAPVPATGFTAGCVVLLLGLLALAAVTFLGSTLVRSPIPAAGLGLAAIVVTATVASIPHAGRFSPFGLGGVAIDVALGRAPTDWAWPVAVNVGIVLTALAAGCLVFRRQDL